MSGLVLDQVSVQRAGFPIVTGIDLHAPSGQVTILLGPNGAGKTTLMDAISGVIPAEAGSIRLGAHDITRADRVKRARAGLAHVEQGRTVFPDLTTEENLTIVGGPDAWARGIELFPELTARRSVAAGSLSGGEQQMLVIARALAADPSVILIDEMSLGLAPIIVKRLMPVVRQLAGQGVGVLLVEQYAIQALSLGDTAYVLSRGRIAYRGPAADLLSRPDVLHRAYLGVSVGAG